MMTRYRQAAIAGAVAGAVVAASCAPQERSQSEAGPQQGTRDAAPSFAVANFPAGPAPAAIFNGSFVVSGGCLLFRTAETDYLPVFGSDAKITVDPQGVTIGGRRLPFNRQVAIGGGLVERPASLQVRGGAASCNGETVRVASIIG